MLKAIAFKHMYLDDSHSVTVNHISLIASYSLAADERSHAVSPCSGFWDDASR